MLIGSGVGILTLRTQSTGRIITILGTSVYILLEFFKHTENLRRIQFFKYSLPKM